MSSNVAYHALPLEWCLAKIQISPGAPELPFGEYRTVKVTKIREFFTPQSKKTLKNSFPVENIPNSGDFRHEVIIS
jgi:hypothetical protein